MGSLNLAGNDLSGLIPAVLGDMASLGVLFLDDNVFAWPPPANLVSPRPGLLVFLPLGHEWAPAAPQGVAAAARLDALEVSWDLPAPGEPFVDGYRVYFRRAGTSGPLAAVEAAAARVLVEGLAAAVAYEVVVSGYNYSGAGAPSQPVEATPLETPCAQAAVVDQSMAALVSDCDALWAQRRALTGAAAIADAPAGAWNDRNPITAWRGVAVTHNRVTEVDLAGLDLAGDMAPALGDLDLRPRGRRARLVVDHLEQQHRRRAGERGAGPPGIIGS